MGERLNVQHDDVLAAVKKMTTAYDDFKTITSDGFDDEIELLDKMNSDFVDKLTQVLSIVDDWDLDSLTNNMEDYLTTAKDISDKISGADDTLAEAIEH